MGLSIQLINYLYFQLLSIFLVQYFVYLTYVISDCVAIYGFMLCTGTTLANNSMLFGRYHKKKYHIFEHTPW